jgi:hypothetical protein
MTMILAPAAVKPPKPHNDGGPPSQAAAAEQ